MARPKEFNPDEVLDKAMHVFWHKGYEATSMEDLLKAMDLNRGSLYDTFGDKRELFIACMDRYCTGMVAGWLSTLDQPGSALAAVRKFLRVMLDTALSDPTRKGCLVANTAMELAPHEREIGQRVAHALTGVEEAFFNVLVRAKKQGELKKGQDPRALARYLTGMMQGVVVMYKAGMPAQTLTDVVETGLSVLE